MDPAVFNNKTTNQNSKFRGLSGGWGEPWEAQSGMKDILSRRSVARNHGKPSASFSSASPRLEAVPQARPQYTLLDGIGDKAVAKRGKPSAAMKTETERAAHIPIPRSPGKHAHEGSARTQAVHACVHAGSAYTQQCTHAGSARTHARSLARSHARTHARTLARKHAWKHARMLEHART